jgi:hypothetical protein
MKFSRAREIKTLFPAGHNKGKHTLIANNHVASARKERCCMNTHRLQTKAANENDQILLLTCLRVMSERLFNSNQWEASTNTLMDLV